MKVLLIYPNFPAVATQPPLGLMYIASVLREHGHMPRIIEGDAEAVQKQFEQLPVDEVPDYIGITCMTSMYHEIIGMRNYFHQWNIPIIFGGVHATILPDSFLTKTEHLVDYVVKGEGEITVLQIVDGKIFSGSDLILNGEPPVDLDLLPFPARDLVNKKYLRHSVSIMAARGCPFNCNFCQPTLRKIFGNQVRRRSVENVISEMVQCLHQFAISDFEFFDDTFTGNPGWVYDFCEMVKKTHFTWKALSRADTLDYDLLKTMKDAGLTKLRLGIESASQEMLNSYGKGVTVEQNHEALEMCSHLGIKVHGFFMVGGIGETKESIEQTKVFIRNHDFDTVFVTVTTPTPCTKLYDRAKMEGRLKVDWKEFDLLGSLTTTVHPRNLDHVVSMMLDNLSARDVLKARYDILRMFYMRKVRNPAYLWRFIRNNSLGYFWEAAKNVFHGVA